MVSVRRWLSSARARRGVAAAVVVLATGGLVLARSPGGGQALTFGTAVGKNASSFSGPGASGTLALSQTRVLTGGQSLYAELKIRGDDEERARERAPISLAIVFDTSGSMSGDKIETSKRSVVSLLRQMRADDEVAFVRYDDHSEVLQPLARVGDVREELTRRVQSLEAGGGTNIPPALERGLSAVSDASGGRVRRVVLVSDGLDSTRDQAERLARSALDRRVTISALGIGLDFDESYMSAVANAGRGNFGFVRDGTALASFLHKELEETASTVVEDARATLTLPRGMRFVQAIGAETRHADDGEVELALGSLFAGDERRIIVELSTDAEQGESLALGATVSWQKVGGSHTRAKLAALSVVGDSQKSAVAESRDPAVYASAVSALASVRQLAAAESFAHGDEGKAQELLDQNMAALSAAEAEAPAEVAAQLARQRADVSAAKSGFRAAKPGSPKAKALTKAATEKNNNNLSRSAF